MYKTTNIETLGQDYVVSDQNGKILRTIQLIPQDEILEAALGVYTENFTSLASYIEKSIAVLTGFEGLDPTRVLWHATTDDEVVLPDLIEYAVKHGYDKIILEHLEDLD
jgi:hypothetical protein